MGEQVMRQLSRAMTPALSDIEIDWGGIATSVSPSYFPTLFAGNRMIAYAFLNPGIDHGQISFRGVTALNEVKQTFAIDVTKASSSTIFHRLASRALIRDLDERRSFMHTRTEQFRPGFDAQMLKKEAIRLSTTYGVLCSYTAFVAVEAENDSSDAKAQPQPNSNAQQELAERLAAEEAKACREAEMKARARQEQAKRECEAASRGSAEARKQAEMEARMRAEMEARKQAESCERQREEECRRPERRRMEEEQRRAEEERRKCEEMEARRRAEMEYMKQKMLAEEAARHQAVLEELSELKSSETDPAKAAAIQQQIDEEIARRKAVLADRAEKERLAKEAAAKAKAELEARLKAEAAEREARMKAAAAERAKAEAERRKREAFANRFVNITGKQKFKGNWTWPVLEDTSLVTAESAAALLAAKPAAATDEVWATLLILAWLEHFCAGDRVKWNLLVQKAQRWLKKQSVENEWTALALSLIPGAVATL
eukprot:TRINITY_DN11231_c0_g4_i1.p1 TRINITY_DN11231_c0_g4~~TRINITY_DN11231_c0_g4_i1.p1  ORF type:complete len:500 (-),score=150.68 TRINITY_DN11231_c0_g4_i1:59-1519(-)